MIFLVLYWYLCDCYCSFCLSRFCCVITEPVDKFTLKSSNSVFFMQEIRVMFRPHRVDAACCDKCHTLYGLSVTDVPVKMAEPLDMPFDSVMWVQGTMY